MSECELSGIDWQRRVIGLLCVPTLSCPCDLVPSLAYLLWSRDGRRRRRHLAISWTADVTSSCCLLSVPCRSFRDLCVGLTGESCKTGRTDQTLVRVSSGKRVSDRGTRHCQLANTTEWRVRQRRRCGLWLPWPRRHRVAVRSHHGRRWTALERRRRRPRC